MNDEGEQYRELETIPAGVRRMAGKLGLVFAGGGGKGAYAIGVWKALKEAGLDTRVQAVAGTSVGALNAALFLQGDQELAERVWLDIAPGKILSVDLSVVLRHLARVGLRPAGALLTLARSLAEHGVFSRKGLLRLIDAYMDIDKITGASIPCYVTCCERTAGRPTYFKINGCDRARAISLLLASSAIPVVFRPERIDGGDYIDGGAADNVPVQPVYDEGCDLILVVHVSRTGLVDKHRFPNARIVEFVPSEAQGGFIAGTLDFSPERARRRIEQGYRDAIRILRPFLGLECSVIETGQPKEEPGCTVEPIADRVIFACRESAAASACREDAVAAEGLALIGVSALAACEARLRELRGQKAFSRLWNTVMGRNRRLEAHIAEDLAAGRQALERLLDKVIARGW